MTLGSSGSKGKGHFVLGESAEPGGCRGQASHTQTLASANYNQMLHHPELQGGEQGGKGRPLRHAERIQMLGSANVEVSSLGSDRHSGNSTQKPARLWRNNNFFLHKQDLLEAYSGKIIIICNKIHFITP